MALEDRKHEHDEKAQDIGDPKVGARHSEHIPEEKVAQIYADRSEFEEDDSQREGSPRLSASKSRSISAWLIGCLKAMQASTSSVAVVSPEFAFARVCSLKYAAKALLWTSVVRSETTPLIIRS